MRPVCKHYAKEFGEEIPSAYLESFTEHGLVLSRYKSSIHVKRCGGYSGLRRALFEVKDSKYLAKFMGFDSLSHGQYLTNKLRKCSQSEQKNSLYAVINVFDIVAPLKIIFSANIPFVNFGLVFIGDGRT